MTREFPNSDPETVQKRAELLAGSLRKQWLYAFLLSSACLVAILTTIAWWFADQRSKWEIEARMHSIASQVAQPTFPINNVILKTISSLTGAELVLVNQQGAWVEGTIEPRPRNTWQASDAIQHALVLDYDEAIPPANSAKPRERSYHAGWFKFHSPRQPNIEWVIILFPESTFQQIRWQAAFFPMFTGISMALVLGCIASILSNRIVRRIEGLSHQVRRIASGDYQEMPFSGPHDEISSLSTDVNQMCRDLKNLDARIHETERDRLIHNMATGISHDLRNTLTGARLAIQLHARQCKTDPESTEVAMRQLRVAEDQLQRWLRMSGEEWIDGRESIGAIIDRAFNMVHPTADHLDCTLQLVRNETIEAQHVEKSGLLCSAILNLLFNAVQAAGSRGEVSLTFFPESNQRVTIEVNDSGNGPDPAIQDKMFEPLVTSKPEGVGLGLPMVAKAAKQLGGDVSWRRENDRTIFAFTFQATTPN